MGLAFDKSGKLNTAGVDNQMRKITAAGAVSLFATGGGTLTYIAVTDDAGRPLPLPPANVPELSASLLSLATIMGMRRRG